MEKIITLKQKTEKSKNEKELACMKSKFILVLSADYQMFKLILHWGYSPQAALTYYCDNTSPVRLVYLWTIDDSRSY